MASTFNYYRGAFALMKRNLILVSSTVLLVAIPAFAADKSQASSDASSESGTPAAKPSGVQTYNNAPAVTPKGKAPAAKPVTTATAPATAAAAPTTTAANPQYPAIPQVAPAGKTPLVKGGKLQIPPPPVETLPGGAIPALGKAKPATKPAVDNTVTTVATDAYVSKTRDVQRFVTYVDLKPGMETAPLTMTMTNSGFQWFRILIANQVIATEKSLKKGEGKLDLTGTIQAGTNQLVITAGGAPGAKFEWKITTPAVAKIDKLEPADEVLVGSDLKIKGKNFSTDPSKDDVSLNKTKGQVSKAKVSELTVKVPMNAEAGDNLVSVKVNGVESNKVKIKIRQIPELTGTNIQGVGPGMPLDLYGKNFSKDMSENRVFFGDTQANIIQGSTNQLTIIVPQLPLPASDSIYQPPPFQVKVQVGKVMSKNSVPINVGFRVWSEPGVDIGGKNVPTLNPSDMPGGMTIYNPY